MDRMYMHFLTGISPHYVGLHDAADTIDGYSFTQIAHANGGDEYRHPTIALPLPFREMEDLYADHGLTRTILHEAGHILDYTLPWRPEMTPVTEYAKTTRSEAFAEAFENWMYNEECVFQVAPEAVAFFDTLGDVHSAY